MANYVSIQQAMDSQPAEQTVSVRGWCYRERGSNKFKFIVVRDSTNIIQCIVNKKTVSSEVWDKACRVTMETSLKLTGDIRKDDRAPTGFEIDVKDLDIIGESDTFPITKDQSTEFLLDKRHLWIRSRKLTSVMKVRSTVFGAIHEFYRSRGYHEFAPPIFTPNACEGGSTLFEVKYFDDKVYLTQSWQLYAEAAVHALEKIYCVSPCFRSERSKTSRHLAEFWMAEMESAWSSLQDITELAKELVAFIVQKVIQVNRNELEILGQDVSSLEKITLPFETITYTKALDILKDNGVNVPWGKDLRTIEEDELMKHFDKPLVITNYPKSVMAFYKPVDPKDPKTALCFDMLAPGGYGEIVGGSERDTDIKSLIKGLKDEGEQLENYEWYLDLRRFGSVPHSGFGLGVERVIAWLCNLDNIKDAIPFPRTLLRNKP